MEEFRDERLSKIMSWMQSWVRGYLSRKRFRKLQEQRLALTVVQRSLKKYLKIRTWPWWKLWQKVKPLLNASRIEDQIAVSYKFNFSMAHTVNGSTNGSKLFISSHQSHLNWARILWRLLWHYLIFLCQNYVVNFQFATWNFFLTQRQWSKNIPVETASDTPKILHDLEFSYLSRKKNRIRVDFSRFERSRNNRKDAKS